MIKRPYHAWEVKHGLFNKKCIDGFQYWNYMRRDMAMSFNDEYAGVEPAFYQSIREQKKAGLFSRIKKAAGLLLPDNLGRIKKSDILFFCHPRRQEIDGKMVSIYTDYTADDFPGSVTVQRSGLGQYREEDIYSRNIAFLDRISIKGYIYRYIRMIFTPLRYRAVIRQIKKDMEEPFRDLIENYGLNPDPDEFAERAAILYFLYKYKYPRYLKLLKTVSPRVIVEVVGLGFDAQIINEAACELGIETVELQHGTGAYSICFPEDLDMRQFPKWYFTFGDFWSKAMQPPIKRSHIISAGFPYHDLMMGKYPREKRERDRNTVIFLSSRKYGEHFSELAKELKKLRPGLHIIYKLHPREYADYKERYPALKDSGLEIIDDNSVPLYGLFSRCSMQVGVESTAIYEGMSFALTTYIWDIPKAIIMKDITEMGYAFLFKDAKALAELMDVRKDGSPDYDVNDFWKGNARKNIEEGIKGILDGSLS